MPTRGTITSEGTTYRLAPAGPGMWTVALAGPASSLLGLVIKVPGGFQARSRGYAELPAGYGHRTVEQACDAVAAGWTRR